MLKPNKHRGPRPPLLTIIFLHRVCLCISIHFNQDHLSSLFCCSFYVTDRIRFSWWGFLSTFASFVARDPSHSRSAAVGRFLKQTEREREMTVDWVLAVQCSICRRQRHEILPNLHLAGASYKQLGPRADKPIPVHQCCSLLLNKAKQRHHTTWLHEFGLHFCVGLVHFTMGMFWSWHNALKIVLQRSVLHIM